MPKIDLSPDERATLAQLTRHRLRTTRNVLAPSLKRSTPQMSDGKVVDLE
jgi:hypothetical protein